MSTPQKPQSAAEINRSSPILLIVLTAILCGLWWFLSGYTVPLILGLGAVSIAFTVYLAHRMQIIDREGVPIALFLKAIPYWIWLGKEIVVANIDVMKRVIAVKPDIDPQYFEAKVTQTSELGQAIYANSITLTPGTVSVDLDPGVIQVHALSKGGMDDILSGEMDKRCTDLDGSH